MSAPQPPNSVVRHYRSDGDYTADAANMTSAGWRVADLRRAPDNTIIATYMYGGTPVTKLESPVNEPSAPMSGASTVPSSVAPGGSAPPPQPLTQPLPPVKSDKQARIDRIALGVAAALVILLCATCAVSGSLSSASNASALATAGASASTTASSANATASAVYAASLSATQTAVPVAYATSAAQPTFPALPTITPGPSPVNGPYLGGTLDSFSATFGPGDGPGVWYTTLNGQSVMLSVQASANSSGGGITIITPDGQDRVWTIGLSYLGSSPPTTAQNAAICRQLMPSDAQHIADNANAPLTPEHIYRSQQLAASFEANAFQNEAGADVAPGTFDVFYGARSCDIIIGQI